MLFQPFALRGVELPNRIVVSPMGQYSARQGCATDWHMMHLGHLAVSGAGLLIAEAAAVHPDGRGSASDLGLWCDANAAALAPVFDFCRRHGGARLGMQLYHAGRKGSITAAWEGQKYVPPEQGGWPVCGPSAVPYPGRGQPAVLDRAGMDMIRSSFVEAARRADGIGVDLIEMHAAHGYLLHQFLSPLVNRRNDAYGGDLAGRMRFPLEVFDAIRRVWPERKALGVRISATDWVEGGWDIGDSVAFCSELRARGCDFVAVSSGGTVPEQRPQIGPGYQVGFAARIRREAGIPTMAIGLITQPRQAEDILVAGQADMVALARAMLYDPRWPWHAAVELGENFFCPPQYLRSHPSLRDVDFLRPARSP